MLQMVKMHTAHLNQHMKIINVCANLCGITFI